MKKASPFYPVKTCESSHMQRIPQLWQMVLRKGIGACQLFFSSLNICGPLYKRVTSSIGQAHQPLEDKATQAGLQPIAATTLIINISNSTLIDCIIGNDSYPSAVVESQPLMQASTIQMHEHLWCSCSCGQQGAAHPTDPPPPSEEPQSINIHSSQLSCVIIGDYNSMHVEQTHQSGAEPQL